MNEREALKLALEFIERVNKDGWILADFEPQMYAVITAIKEALAQPEQEPVAYSGNGTAGRETDARPTGFFFQMPPQRTWVGLTDEEITEIRLKSFDSIATNRAVYEAIEAKLREKNGG